jgi:hypothetical protein
MPSPGGALCLDLSFSSTGYAYGCLGEKPVFGSQTIGKLDRPGRAYAVLEDHCDDWIRTFQPSCVVYEAPLPTNRKSKPGENTRQTNDSAIGQIRLGAIVELISQRHEVRCFHQHCGAARAKVLGSNPTGKSDAIKAKIMAWARDRGWQVRVSDEADALVLLAFSIVKLDTTGKAHFFRHGELL